MDIGKPFIDMGPVAIDAITAYVERLTVADWQADMRRQMQYREHQQAQAILFRFNGQEHPHAAGFLPLLAPILARLPGLDLASCFLAKLPAQRQVMPHDDIGAYFAMHHRFHVPIITNDRVRFKLGDLQIHMEQGRLYEINNCVGLHSCKNDGETARVHLIFDMEDSDAA